jgi:hypothetical protein
MNGRATIAVAPWRNTIATMLPGEAPQPDYSEDGVDLSLIRWMLSLTPAERLDFAERHLNEVLAIRERNAS